MLFKDKSNLKLVDILQELKGYIHLILYPKDFERLVSSKSFDVLLPEKSSLKGIQFFLNDYGISYHGRLVSSPNPYGPIVLRFSPRFAMIMDAFDISITPQDWPEFDPDHLVQNLSLLYDYISDKGERKSFAPDFLELRASLNHQSKHWSYYLEDCLVDPIDWNGKSLKALVTESLSNDHDINMKKIKIFERSKFKEEKQIIHQLIQEGYTSYDKIAKIPNLSPIVKRWAERSKDQHIFSKIT